MQEPGTPVMCSSKHAVVKSASLCLWQSCNRSGRSGRPEERASRVSAADKHACLVCKAENLSTEVKSSVGRINLHLSFGREPVQAVRIHIRTKG